MDGWASCVLGRVCSTTPLWPLEHRVGYAFGSTVVLSRVSEKGALHF